MKPFSGLLLFMLYTAICVAQNHRALVIGINQYAPGPNVKVSQQAGRTVFSNLQGCKNDAQAMKSILELRFGFNPQNIQELYDNQATRSSILRAFQNLLDKCRAGDIAFVYYAGHGSQQRNSKSTEADKMDESIVPADTWKEGIEDIRDKEQARLYTAFLDKGVKLTVIMDCCHSGSMSRGQMIYGAPVYRYLPENNLDANDNSNPAAPETREGNNFLMISATQDDGLAEEQTDDHKNKHGAFTLALMQALEQQTVDASVTNLFISIRAILKSNGKKQEPQIAGSTERQKQTLFDITKGKLSNKILVPVSGIQQGVISFMAGFAVGLNPENELTMVSDPSVVAKIDAVQGTSLSTARIIKGKLSSVKPGALFEITNWVSSAAQVLKIFIPPSSFSYTDIYKLATVCEEVRSSDKVTWVNDLNKYYPEASVWYKEGAWVANLSGELHSGIKTENAQDIIRLTKGKPLFFNLPPDKDLINIIAKRFMINQNIALVSDITEATYLLCGTINKEGLPSYGLLNTAYNRPGIPESLPVQTDYFTLAENNEDARERVAEKLYENAARLAKVRGWLMLKGPGNDDFPFHLSVISQTSKKEIETGNCKIGDKIDLYLMADKKHTEISIPQKYIYVFSIDRTGKMDLIIPSNHEDNRIPSFVGKAMVTRKLLFHFQVDAPASTNNLYLLASDEPISNADFVFTQEGVKTRDLNKAGQLGMLLNQGNEGSRELTKLLTNWNLLRLTLRSGY